MKEKIYKKQIGGDHYKSMVIQPSEFINKNNIPFAEGYNLENLAHGVDGVGGLEQIINTLTSTPANKPFGEEEKKNQQL